MKREFYIAGVQFRERKEINFAASSLRPNDKCLLETEPTNRFDSNAVKIIYSTEAWDDIFLGYVPKKYSAEISALIEVGVNLECKVIAVNAKAQTYEMFQVVVQEKGDEDEDDNFDECKELIGDEE